MFRRSRRISLTRIGQGKRYFQPWWPPVASAAFFLLYFAGTKLVCSPLTSPLARLPSDRPTPTYFPLYLRLLLDYLYFSFLPIRTFTLVSNHLRPLRLFRENPSSHRGRCTILYSVQNTGYQNTSSLYSIYIQNMAMRRCWRFPCIQSNSFPR